MTKCRIPLLFFLLALGLALAGCSVSSTSTSEVSASYSVTEEGDEAEDLATEDVEAEDASEAYINRDYLLETYPWAAVGEGDDGCTHYLLYDNEDVTQAMLVILDEEAGSCTFAEGPVDWEGDDMTIHDTEEEGAFITLTVTESLDDGLQVRFQDDTTADLAYTDAEETVDQILELFDTVPMRPLLLDNQ